VVFFRIENVGDDKSFDGNVKNFLAKINSPNCLGKVIEFFVDKTGSDCTNTFEIYSIESDFDTWNKVCKTYSKLCIYYLL